MILCRAAQLAYSVLYYAGRVCTIICTSRLPPKISYYLFNCPNSSPMPPKPRDKKETDEEPSAGQSQAPALSRHSRKFANLFAIPPPVKALFDHVPILIYPANELPQRTPKPARIPSLYVFSKKGDVAAGRPSFNPSCLKWQVCQLDMGGPWPYAGTQI